MSTERPPETIGQRLRRLRRERSLSQRELAAPGVSYAYISRIEAGTRQPSVKALRKLAPKLGVTTEYLETGSDVRDEELRELRLAQAALDAHLSADPAAARDELQAVREEAERRGDALTARRARIALGLASAEAGDAATAIELLEQAVEAGDAPPALRPDVYRALGGAYLGTGRAAQTVELFERCLDGVVRDRPSDRSTRLRYATYLGSALVEAGQPVRASQVLREVTGAAHALADPAEQARSQRALARAAAAEGRPREALAHARRALVLREAADDAAFVERALRRSTETVARGDS